MFKIIQQKSKEGFPIPYYEVHCYYLDKDTNTNKEAYYVRNLTRERLEEYMADHVEMDMDFGMIVLKSTGSCIFVSSGEILPVPVPKVTYN